MTDLEQVEEHQNLQLTSSDAEDFGEDESINDHDDGQTEDGGDDDDDDDDENENEEDRERAAADEFRSLMVVLASCRPDVMSPKDRKALMDEAADRLQDDPRRRLQLATWKEPRCSSFHAYRRIVSLVTLCLSLTVQDGGEENQTAGTAASEVATSELLRLLSRLLEQAGKPSLVQSAIQELQAIVASNGDKVRLATSIASHLDDPAAQASETPYSAVPAAEIGCALAAAAGPAAAREEGGGGSPPIDASAISPGAWIRRLFAHTLGDFVPRNDLQLARNCIGAATNGDWRNVISPALLLKLKSHPDKVLDTILGWIEFLPQGTVDPPDEEWLGLLYKHATSPKDVNRAMARSILFAWATNHGKEGCRAIVTSLALTKPIPTVALSRGSLYDVLERIGSNQRMKSSSDDVMDPETSAAAIEGLLSLLGKEALSKAGEQSNRLAGHRALVEWTVLAKRCRRDDDLQYKKALEYIRAPVLAKKTAGGSSSSPSDPTLGPSSILGLMIERVHPDVLEGIASDLWILADDPKAWSSGLEALTVAATAKKSALVDGLVAVYLSLVYAFHSKKSVPTFAATALDAGSSTKLGASFLYSASMIDVLSSNSLVGLLLPRCIALYTQLSALEDGVKAKNLFPTGKLSAACQVVASCCLFPAGMSSSGSFVNTEKDQYAAEALASCLELILTYRPMATDGLVRALFERVNQVTLTVEEQIEGLNSTREARETERDSLQSVKGQGSVNAAHPGFDAPAVRRVARLLAKQCSKSSIATSPLLARILVLMHSGSTLRSEGHQRAALILNTTTILKEKASLDGASKEGNPAAFRTSLASEIVELCSGERMSLGTDEPSLVDGGISNAVHESGLSLLVTLGGVACNFSRSTDDPLEEDMLPYVFASNLCVDDIAGKLSQRLESCLSQIEGLSEQDVTIAVTPPGTLYEVGDPSRGADARKSKRLTEDEEWELQMRRELAEKTSSTQGNGQGLSQAQLKLLAEQDAQRTETAKQFQHFGRVLRSVRYLCSSDIEVGNECLPVVMNNVLAASISTCPAISEIVELKSQSYLCLLSLAASVFEIDEKHAPTIAHALLVAFRKGKGSQHADTVRPGRDSVQKPLQVSPLPSPCAPAAGVTYEMDQLHESMSAPSFIFLFPILHAALMGPRTPPGCEAALRVLARHTEMLTGERSDSRVKALRREMAVSVLELLKHDRAQTFQNPTPADALVLCYKTDVGTTPVPVLSAGELAPLLDDRGSLGNKNCRCASMTVLIHLAELHGHTLKSNPLVENRVWLNCFEMDEEVRQLARNAWVALQGCPASDIGDDAQLPPPSLLYSAPLLPLLSHVDKSIALAAAQAYATALGKHPSSVARNIEALCKFYIDSFPSSVDVGETKPAPPISKSSPAPSLSAKKPGLSAPKKKALTVKSPLEIAGIGKPKVAKKKQVSHSALLKPKEERTLDQAALVSQFKIAEPSTKEDEKDSQSKIDVRLGVLRALASTTTTTVQVVMDESTLVLVTSFLMAYGIAESHEVLKAAARNTLRDIVATKGGTEEAIAFLLPHLESVLTTGVADETSLGSLSTEKVPRSVSASDRRKEGAVVALGSVALHLKGTENESKIDTTLDMLVSALRTPSEDVQLSVADAMTKLMKKGRTQDRIEALLSGLLKDCLQSDSLAVQRGAAYGLSAVVKGSGIASLKKYEIVKQLEDACSAGSANAKEGALFAIELLCDRLGLLFEPYVISLLPTLLKSFSDSNDHVRKAAANTVGMIMSKLSAHGVKLVMPAVLTAFNDPAWRTKQASIHMLGAMSHLAPKQLASALPKVVPKLTEAFSDTHPKVKGSAQEALLEISTVVRNPEISSISSVLLKALTDPADYTVKALESLIETEFLHAIDAPSLALIVPILHRGLRERGATTKRFSGLIAGNITTMINDPKDFVPYIPTLLPDLQTCLLDPIPDVRSTSAKALGSLTRSLGDQILPELRPWLLAKLRDEHCSSAERSGAAQGLTEVLIASGSTVVEDAMRNEILPLRSHPGPGTREGVLWMLTFLPPSLGQGFTSLIDVSLPALIKGLSDDSEPVRDVALRAGRVLIRSHGKVHADKILPSLEDGLKNSDYRIRVASLSLLGDLLSMIGGTSLVKGDGDTQDDIRKAEKAQTQIALSLGTDTRKRVLSGLYLARSDSVHVVRQSALQVWKTVVSVTGRALRDILPVLVSKIIDDLACGVEERTTVAGRCLGDIVGKLGDSVLPQVIPVLQKSLYAGDEYTKQGVCVGLTEVISCSTRDQILRYLEIIVKVVQDALSDDDASVRRMAATSFQSLYSLVGSRALDEVVPSLMVALEIGDDKSRHKAMNGLTSILSVRSRDLLPYIIPRLIQRPFTVDHAKALAGVATVTGSTIYYHFSSIIPALLFELADRPGESDDAEAHAVRECSRSICRSVSQEGVNILISEVASKCGSDKAPLRRECCKMLEVIVTERAEFKDFYDQIPIILRELLYRLNDDDATVLQATNLAFAALSKEVSAEELVNHVEFMRNLIASMVSEARRRKGGVGDGEFLLPGFNMPKGLDPFIPIFQRGILYGSPTIREVSAAGLGELISLTSSKNLAGPMIVKMTGPLLRIVGDRNPSTVKIAILKTLGLILVKGGPALRAFVPQFQTTFVKSLSDPSRQVRMQAIDALSLLMPLSTRVDPLIKELVSGSLGKNAPVEGLAAAAVQTATLEALSVVLSAGGDKAKLSASIPSALEASIELLKGPDDGIRGAAAKVLGEACSLSGLDVVQETIRTVILDPSDNDSSYARHGKACAIRRILASRAGGELGPSLIGDLRRLCVGYLSDDKSLVREAGFVALGAVIGRTPDPKAGFAMHQPDLLKVLGDPRENMDVHRSLAKGLCLALSMVPGPSRLDAMGVPLVDACLQLTLSGTQRVQFALYDVLWMALDVASGSDGLDRYASMALFDNVRAMKSLHSKVLVRIKEVSLE